MPHGWDSVGGSGSCAAANQSFTRHGAARVNDDVGGNRVAGAVVTFDAYAVYGARLAIAHHEPGDGDALQNFHAALLDHIAAQQVFEYHPPAGKETDLLIARLEVDNIEGGGGNSLESQFFGPRGDEPLQQIGRVPVDEIDQWCQQHVAVPCLRSPSTLPGACGIEVILR